MSKETTPIGALVRRLSIVLLTVGVPLGAVSALRDWAISQPLKAALLLILYEALLAVTGFLTKVTSGLEGRWVQRAVDRVDVLIRQRLSRFRSKYLEYLVFQHREFDVKGLTTRGSYTLELQQVFVDLGLLPQSLHRISSDPLYNDSVNHADRDFLERAVAQRSRHSIWELLDPRVSRDHYAIIGAPGSGKTTLLKHVALSLTKRSRRFLGARRKPLPILLFLRDHTRAIKENPTLTITDAIRSRLPRRLAVLEPPLWFEAQLARGNCILMLDGLDEVADTQARRAVADWVEGQINTYSRNRFIVTSRPHGYKSNPLTPVTLLEVRPFTTEQVHRFVLNWYVATLSRGLGKTDEGVRMDAEEGAQDLLRRLQNSPALTDLAVNPLLLTMISNVHYFRSMLPGRRVELYSEICEVFLGKRQSARGIEYDVTPSQKQLVLQELAFWLMRANRREIAVSEAADVITESVLRVGPGTSPSQFLQLIEQSSGLLVERELGVYSFAHLTFQEYLASVYIKEHRLEKHLISQLDNPWWHETIRLYVAQSDATAIIAACLENMSVHALTLAVECLEEAREVHPEMRMKVDTTLAEETEAGDAERNRMLTRVQLALRLRRMVRVGDAYVATSFITNAEYQLFLDELALRSEWHQPDHWTQDRFPDGRGTEAVLGMRWTDAERFCSWLNERELAGWHYRLPMPGELTRYGPIISSEMRHEAGYWSLKDKGSWEGYSQYPEQRVSIGFVQRDIIEAANQDVLDEISTFDGLLQLSEMRPDGMRTSQHLDRNWLLKTIARKEQLSPQPPTWLEATDLPISPRLITSLLIPMLLSAEIHSRPNSRWTIEGRGFMGESVTTRMFSSLLFPLSHIDIEGCMHIIGELPMLFDEAKKYSSRNLLPDGRYVRSVIEQWSRECLPWVDLAIRLAPLAFTRHPGVEVARQVTRYRWHLRWLALLVANNSDFLHNIPNGPTQVIEAVREVFRQTLHIYTSLAILERRRYGELAPSEALLIMKEPSIRL